jgi:hypothetical protein
MHLHLPDDCSEEQVLQAYYRFRLKRDKSITAIARIAGHGRRTIRTYFENWGWKKVWLETKPVKPAAPSAAQPSSLPSVAQAAEARLKDYLRRRP